MIAPNIAAPGITGGNPDLDRIKRNVAKMASQGAPEADIDGYIQSEGVTVDQVRNHRSGNWLQRTARGAVDMVRGQQDPAYAGTPTVYEQFTDELRSPTATAAMLGAGDAGMADIIQQQLGDRFVRREKDANGYEVIVTRGPDGQEQRGYVNAPGLDSQDLWRTLYGAVPYVAGGGAVGALTRNVGRSVIGNLGLRAGAQGATAGAISAGGDAAATTMGSEQGIDPGKAALAAGFGAGAELASPLFQAGKNMLGFGTKYIDDAGKLTKDGIEAARRAGVDPKTLDAETTAAFAEAMRTARDPVEALASVRTNRFGIPTTKGQRTKDPQLLTIEKGARSGTLGDDAKAALEALDRDQRQAIQNQVRGHVVPGRDGIDEYRGIGAKIAPTRMPHEQNAQTMGQSIRGGLTEARDALKSQERAAWDAVPDITPRAQAFEDLPEALRSSLGRLRVTPEMTNAASMARAIDDYISGNAFAEPVAKVLQQTPVKTLDEMRRQLLGMYKNAAPGTSDAKAAKAIYDGFNDWVWSAAEKGLINGDPAAAAKMNAAREITREVKSLLQPRNAQGRNTPANRIISQVMDEADTPERVIASLLGEGGPQTTPKSGVVDALTRMKAILDKGGSEAGSMAARETWNDIRLAYWLRLTTDKGGNVLSPTMLKKNIDQAFTSQGAVLNTLFSEAERREFRAFARAVGEAAYKDPNPSGTATALKALTGPGSVKQSAQLFFQTQSKRELFSKHNVLLSRIYALIAKNVPNVGGGSQKVGLRAAERAVSQRLSPKRPPSLGPFGGAYGAQSGRE